MAFGMKRFGEEEGEWSFAGASGGKVTDDDGWDSRNI